MRHAAADGAHGGTQDDPRHVVAQGAARHCSGAVEGREVLLPTIDADLRKGGRRSVWLDHRERQRCDHPMPVDRDRQRQADRVAGRRQAALHHNQYVAFVSGHAGGIQVEQGLFQQRCIGAQFGGLAVARRGQVLFAQGFVDETGQVMAERALVAVLQAHHVRRVEAFYRVATQILELGGYALALGFVFALEVFLVPQFGDHRFAFVGFLDFGARAVEVIDGQQVQRHLGGEHDFFIVIPFVAPHLVVDQEATELREIALGVELDRLLPLVHHQVCPVPSRLAAGQIALGPQQLAFFEVVEKVFVFAAVVLLQQGQRAIDIAAGQLLVGGLQFSVVAAEHRTARQQRECREGKGGKDARCH